MALDRTGRFALVANYGEGAGSVTVYRVEPDGRLGDLTDHVKLTGDGPDPVRQATSHAHMVTSDPVTGDILVTDLGSDAILVYALDDDGPLTPKTAAYVTAVPGAGPRHLAFHPDGRHLFVVNELDSTVCALRREDDRWLVMQLRADLARRSRRPEPGGRHPGDPVRAARPGVQPGSRQPRRAALRPGRPRRCPRSGARQTRGSARWTPWSPPTWASRHRGPPGQRSPGELRV